MTAEVCLPFLPLPAGEGRGEGSLLPDRPTTTACASRSAYMTTAFDPTCRRRHPYTSAVMHGTTETWIPAFAGMTAERGP